MINVPEDQELTPLESVYIHYVWVQMLNSPATGTGRSLGATFVLNRYGPNLSSKAVKLAVLAFGCRSKNRLGNSNESLVLQYLGSTYQHLRDAIERDAYFEIAYACYFIIRCHSEVAWDSRDLTELTTHTLGLMTTLLKVVSSCSFNREEFVVLSCALCDWYMELASFFEMQVEHVGEPGIDQKGIVDSSLALGRLGESWSEVHVDLGNEPNWLQSIHEATQLIFPLMEVERCLHYCLFMNDTLPLKIRSASDTLQRQLSVSRMFLLRHDALVTTFPQILKKSTGLDEALELGQALFNLLLVGYVALLGPVIHSSLDPLLGTHAMDATRTIGQSLQRLDCLGEVLPVTANGLFILTGQLFDKLHEYQGNHFSTRSNKDS